MPYLWWTLTLVLMLIGLLGTMLPLLPGTTIILFAAGLHCTLMHWAQGRAMHAAQWVMLAGLTVLTVFSYVIDLLSGTVGAKWFGATKWGAWGGILGAIVGLFFGIIGVFVGPLVGVLLGELLGGKELLPAGKSTWGTLLGTGVGIVLRFAVAVVMIGWFLAVMR